MLIKINYISRTFLKQYAGTPKKINIRPENIIDNDQKKNDNMYCTSHFVLSSL